MVCKLLAFCLVLCTVEILGGSIKQKPSVEVQDLIDEIDVITLVLDAEVKRVTGELKKEHVAAKSEVKLTIKQLKNVIKAAKGTLCGQIAYVEMKSLEELADEAKVCSQNVDLKEVEHNLRVHLKNMHSDALMIDAYCRFTHAAPEIADCVTENVRDLKQRVAHVEKNILAAIATCDEASEDCVQNIINELKIKSASIQAELLECLNPSTTAASSSTDEKDSSCTPESTESNDSTKSNESTTEEPQSSSSNITSEQTDGETTEESNESTTLQPVESDSTENDSKAETEKSQEGGEVTTENNETNAKESSDSLPSTTTSGEIASKNQTVEPQKDDNVET